MSLLDVRQPTSILVWGALWLWGLSSISLSRAFQGTTMIGLPTNTGRQENRFGVWMTALKANIESLQDDDEAANRDVGSDYRSLGTQRTSSTYLSLHSNQSPDMTKNDEQIHTPSVESFHRAAYVVAENAQKRKRMQQQFLEQDPLAAQESTNGVPDLKPWNVVPQKLTVFSRSIETHQSQTDHKSNSARNKLTPGVARDVSNTEELKVYPKNRYGELNYGEAKKLVRAQSINSVLGSTLHNFETREVSDTEELIMAPQQNRGEFLEEQSRFVQPVSHGGNGMDEDILSAKDWNVLRQGEMLHKEKKKFIRSQSMNAGTSNIARDVNSTEELKVYARNRYGEPILEKPRLVVASSKAALAAGSLLANTPLENEAGEVVGTEEPKVYQRNQDDGPIENERGLVPAQRNSKHKSKTKQYLATTPSAGMSEMLDMSRSKAVSLSSNAAMAASILNSDISDHAAPTASLKTRNKKKSESQLAMSPSDVFPKLHAKSKPVLARTQTAATAATVLQTGVQGQDVPADDSTPIDSKSLFFRHDQANVVQKKGGLAPGIVGGPTSHGRKIFAKSIKPLRGEKRGLAPGLVEGDAPIERKIFTRSNMPTTVEKRGLPPGLIERESHAGQTIFARSSPETGKGERRDIAPGMVTVDTPFQYKQAISSPEFNPANAQTTVGKKRFYINPGLQKSQVAEAPMKRESGVDLDQPFQYKQAQTIPVAHENPAGVKPPDIPVKSVIRSKPVNIARDTPENLTLVSEIHETPSHKNEFSDHEAFYFSVSEPNLVTPIDGTMAKWNESPSPEVSSGALPVVARQPASQKPLAPVEEQYEQKLVIPQSSSMAKASTGPSPEDVYVQVQSGVLSVPIRKKSRKKTVWRWATPAEPKPTSTVPYAGNTMATAVAGPSPEDVYVQIQSGVLSLPFRNRTSKGQLEPSSTAVNGPTSAAERTEVEENGTPQKKLLHPYQNSMAKSYKGLSPEDAYLQMSSGVIPLPSKGRTPGQGVSIGYAPKMAGPGDTPLPNPSGIITFPDPMPQTTPPPGIATSSSAIGRHNPMNPNDITYNSLVDKPKKRLVGHASGSMAKPIEGPYTSLHQEEPHTDSANMFSAPIQNRRVTTFDENSADKREGAQSEEGNESLFSADEET